MCFVTGCKSAAEILSLFCFHWLGPTSDTGWIDQDVGGGENRPQPFRMRKGAAVFPFAPASHLAFLNCCKALLSNKQVKVDGQQRPTDEEERFPVWGRAWEDERPLPLWPVRIWREKLGSIRSVSLPDTSTEENKGQNPLGWHRVVGKTTPSFFILHVSLGCTLRSSLGSKGSCHFSVTKFVAIQNTLGRKQFHSSY